MKEFARGNKSHWPVILTGLLTLSLLTGMNFTASPGGTCLADEFITGSVSGEWDPSNGSYLLYDSVYVEMGNTLVINPGTQVKFAGGIAFYIYGTLTAEGTETDSINFTSSMPFPVIGDWDQIYFAGPPANNSTLHYCTIQYATKGIRLENSSPAVAHCSIRNNAEQGISAFNSSLTLDSSDIYFNGNTGSGYSGMVLTGGSPLIRGNHSHTNYYQGLLLVGVIGGEISGNHFYDNGEMGLKLMDECSNVEISGNYLSYNGYYGMYVDHCGTAAYKLSIHHNVIFKNADDGIYSDVSYANYYNNTLTTNGRDGIFCYSGSVTIYSNIVDNNDDRGIYIQAATYTLNYNDVWNNEEDYRDCNPGVSDISADPIYAFPSLDNYQIMEGSPCIDTGNPASIYNDPDATRSDIGALFFDQTSVGQFDPALIPVSSVIIGNYPNPFNSETVIRLEYPAKPAQSVSIAIHNSLGRLVRTIDVPGERVTETAWDGRDDRGVDLSAGIYYASVAGSNAAKMLLLR